MGVEHALVWLNCLRRLRVRHEHHAEIWQTLLKIELYAHLPQSPSMALLDARGWASKVAWRFEAAGSEVYH